MTGTTAVHVCFGYAVIIHERPSAYSFLPELAQSSVKWVSIETAQFKLDCSILKSLPDKAIILSVLDLSTHEVETLEMLAARIGRALPPDRQADQALAAAVMAMIARHTSAHLAVHLHAGLTRPDFADLLPAISCPMLICAGKRTRCGRLRCIRTWRHGYRPAI